MLVIKNPQLTSNMKNYGGLKVLGYLFHGLLKESLYNRWLAFHPPQPGSTRHGSSLRSKLWPKHWQYLDVPAGIVWSWWVSDGLNQYLSSLHDFFSSSNFDSKTRCVFFHWSLFFVVWVFPYYCFLRCLVLCPHEQPPIMVNILHNPRYHIVASEKMLNNSHLLMENVGVANSLPSKH